MTSLSTALAILSMQGVVAPKPITGRPLSTPAYEHQNWLVSPEWLRMSVLLAHAKRLLVKEQGRHRLVIHRFGTDEDYVSSYQTKGVVDSNFENWQYRVRLLLADVPDYLTPLGQITVWDNRAVVQLRTADSVQREVIGGPDPLKISVPNGQCEILHFLGRVDGRLLKLNQATGGYYCHGCTPNLSVAVVCSRQAESEDMRIVLRYIQRFWPSPREATIWFRTDEFFFDMAEFPMLYAFGTSKSRPWESNVPPEPTRICFLPDFLQED